MGSRPRRFGQGASSRTRIDSHEESFRGREQAEPSKFRGREGRFQVRVRKESPSNRNYKESSNVRSHEEPQFRSDEESAFHSQEGARERIRRENEEHKRSRERSRSHTRHYNSPGRNERRSRSRGHKSRSVERRDRSAERKGRSTERRSGGPRFEPPPEHQLQEMEFNRRQRNSSNDRRERYTSPPHDDMQFIEDGPCMPNRFSPPVQEEFHDMQFDKVDFDSRPAFNQDTFMEMNENNIQLNRPTGSGGPIVMNSRGFSQNQDFASSPHNLPWNQPQPLMGKEFSQNPITNPEFSSNQSDQGFPPTQGSFVDNSFQGFGAPLGRIEGAPGDNEIPLIPEFNPETSKLTSYEWVRLIEDTGQQYDWKKDEKQYIMASRLSGFARQWYLTSGINCKEWGELKQIFLKTFPTEMGFHQLLQKMLARTKDQNETMAAYFHHKVALLNACEILGRKAVSCILAGLPNGRLRHQAKFQNFEDPDELYLYLRSQDSEAPIKTQQKTPTLEDPKNKIIQRTPDKVCYACKALGHIARRCPRKIKDDLRIKPEKVSTVAYNNRVMHGSLARKPTYAKYFTDVSINGITLKAYVDQGSECSTIREENCNLLKLPVKKQYKVIRAFGGSSLSSVGVVDIPLCIDRAIANVKLFVVPDHLQAIPTIVGQSFIEQPHVVVMKDGDKIRFYQRMDNGETNFDF